MTRRQAGARRRPVVLLAVPLAALFVALLAVLVASLVPNAARAQDLSCEAGDRQVRTLRFTGNRAFTDAELARVVVTTPSSAASRLRVIGTRRCLDPEEFPRDVIRLEAYYRRRGYPKATVDTAVRAARGSGGRIVDVTFAVVEGTALRVDTLVVSGFATPRDSARAMRDFPLHPGGVYDRAALDAARDTIVQRLHNTGYLRAYARLLSVTNYERNTANATVIVEPGPFTRIGAVRVVTDTARARRRIPESVARRTLGVRPGDPYSAADIIAAQRTLYQTDAYRRVEVRVDTAGQPDSLVTLVVGLQQGDLQTARVSAGWATVDCLRTQGDFTERYFLPRAQRLEFQARASHIGIGHPLAGAPFLCTSQAKKDLYHDRLNYYLGATVGQPSLFRTRRVPSLTLFTSRASEYNAFRRETSIGTLFSLASRPGSRLPSTLSYQFEIGRTEANAAVFCAVFSACDPPSRGALQRNQPVGALGYSLVHDATDDPLAPTSGSLQRLTLRHSSVVTGSDPTQRFNKGVGEASWYRRLVDDNVLVAHVQVGGVFGDAPQQERLFAGGPTTVRGYAQNQLGPSVYLLSRYDTVAAGGDTLFRAPPGVGSLQRTIPAGGNTLVVANLELQLRSPVLPDLLQLAVFTDAGEVWQRDNPAAAFHGLRVTPGAGVRVKTLFGMIRLDLGYRPYAMRSGAAYVIETLADGTQALYCVSPGNTLPVTLVAGAPRQAPGACPATFKPSTRRLNPSIWIGNAF